MKQGIEHKWLEFVLPLLHNHRDHVKNNPTNKKETHNQLFTQNKITTPHKHHKDFKRTKRIQLIQQIKKHTIETFEKQTMKFMFLRKSKYKLQHLSKNIETTENQRISYNFRPRKQCNINSFASSDESPISSFIPSITSTQSEYPSISHNHTYNRTTSSCE